MIGTDAHWEQWGAQDPYYGVLTQPRFRSAALDTQAREEFFGTGKAHAEHVINTCRRTIDPQFAPQRALDFGCGVGRVAIPLAGLVAEVVGMDVSPSMLAEAQRNGDAAGAGNLKLVLSDDGLSGATGQFDLVHSCIVLQHIEVQRGRELFARLVDLIQPGGIGALQITFAWDLHASTFGQPPVPAKQSARIGDINRLVKRWLGPLAKPAPEPDTAADPEMQMNFYNLSELMFLVERTGAQQVHVEFTNHGGAIGAFVYFRRPS